MKKLLSMTLLQKLMIGAIIIALVPTVGVLVWGVAKAIKSPELQASDWTHNPPATLVPAPIPPDDQQ